MNGRLDEIKKQILPAAVIADVGCDHALIAKYCADNGLAQTVIASDISDACLNKARALLADTENVRFVCCDGIKYDCDEAVIAGMGGLLISKILTAASALPSTVVTCPHRDADCVRKTLTSLGYGIDCDEDVEDNGKFYSVIRGRLDKTLGVRELDELQTLFGVNVSRRNEITVKRLKKLYKTYAVAPDRNAERLSKIVAALSLQGEQI
ncbi:MAG: SAM-dependent methyltransferase [Clostridiales bacterium]|nr:SAM-dependent methyltransferase [Clostridiales bacterium]